MNEKHELAQYLVNLAQIMQGQDTVGSPRSVALAAEYERGYARLKELISHEEKQDETRKSQPYIGTKDGTDFPRSIPGGSVSDGLSSGNSPRSL